MNRVKCRTFPSLQWFTGSIRRKLTFFVILVSLMLIALFWVFGVQMLEPAYNTTIRRDLMKTMDTMAATLDQAYADDVPIFINYVTTSSGVIRSLSSECLERLNESLGTENLYVDNLCIDISDTSLKNIFLHDYLPSQCALHMTDGLLGETAGRNGELVTQLRQRVFETDGIVYHQTSSQMIVGRQAAGGNVALIISANLERIPQAVSVLQQLMIFVSLLLMLLSTLSAFAFSHWFTKPLTNLSGAAKEMAKGNYDVRVQVKGCDEISDLSHDFNVMAKEVKRSSDLQRDILANVSHDLRTPLTLIKGYAETVRDLTGNDPKKRTEQMNVIVNESDRLSALVGSVMELSRMSSGNEKPNPVQFDLTQLCDEMSYRYETFSKQNGYTFVFTGEDRCEVLADPALVERAMHNLLGNALNHVGADGYIGLAIHRTDCNTARVEVIDHGPGIQPDDMPHLFDRYYRARSDAGKQGTGLGLSITKAIFDASGFTYGVESTVGEGSTFWFEAPLNNK